ncbi:MAG TPA: hypothetical protein VD788_16465, partial [Candidatus Polarisedimenticolaceae bacterium]|nr:hypothetical protein [Candidatus Polarisedimenticolaceae bacterium]
QGLCSTADPGPPVVDSLSGSTYPFPLQLPKGGTVTVKAIRSDVAPPGVAGFSPAGGPVVSAQLLVNGTPVSVDGTTTSPNSQTGISFSYSSR